MEVLVLPSWYKSGAKGRGGVCFRNYAIMYHGLSVASRIFYPRLDPFVRKRKMPEAWRKCALVSEDGVECVRYHAAAPPKRSTAFVRYWLRQSVKAFRSYLDEYGKPDLIHAHSYFAGLQAARFKKEFGIPYILTEHSTSILRGKIPPWLKPAILKTYRNSEAFISVSSRLQKAILGTFGLKSKVIPNPVNTELFYIQEKADHSDRPTRIFTSGAKIRHKGLDLLLEGLGMIGSGKETAFHCQIADRPRRPGKLRHLISAHKLEGRVALCGELDQGQMANKMRECDFYVSSSRYETFGLCMIEALCSGTPLVYTRTGAVPDLIGEDSGIGVETGDAEALKDAILQMMERRADYDSRTLRKSVADRVSFKAVGVQYGQILKQLP